MAWKVIRANATKVNFDGNEFFIISYNDLLKNKSAINREIDKSDISELEKKRTKPFN